MKLSQLKLFTTLVIWASIESDLLLNVLNGHIFWITHAIQGNKNVRYVYGIRSFFIPQGGLQIAYGFRFFAVFDIFFEKGRR